MRNYGAYAAEESASLYVVRDSDQLCRAIGRSAAAYDEERLTGWRLDVSIAVCFSYWERQSGGSLTGKERLFVSRLYAAWETVLLLGSLLEEERDGRFESLWKELYQAFAAWLALFARSIPAVDYAAAAEDESLPASVFLDEEL
ncbi:MAG: hypothetical protein FWE85_00990 [Clostridiales bacterium]|nr:hypothetical protein [Clostridiales bacterium]